MFRRYTICMLFSLLCVVFSSTFTLSEEKYSAHWQGMDVSWHNGDVQWEKVKQQNIQFVILKSTEGMDLLDKTFEARWPELKKMGFVRGAYHFYVTEDDPLRQADFFIKSTPLEQGDLAPIVDIEVVGHGTKGRLYPKLKKFLNVLENHYQVKPIIYTSPKFWDKHFHKHLSGYPLWIAEYDVDKPSLPEGWKTWHIWQFTEDATVDGVEKHVDLNRLKTTDNLNNIRIP